MVPPRDRLPCLLLCLATSPRGGAKHQERPGLETPEGGRRQGRHRPAGDDPVVARVNGTVIHRSDLARAALDPAAASAAAAAGPALSAPPRPGGRRCSSLAQAARKAKLDDDPRVKKLMALAEERSSPDAYRRQHRAQARSPRRRSGEPTTSRSIERRRDEEVHARHILVPTEDEAKEIIAAAQQGRRFRQARQRQDDRSRRQGLGRRSRLFHQERHGAGIRQGRLRPQEGRVHPDAGQDPVRLARHQGRGPARGKAADLRGRSRPSSRADGAGDRQPESEGARAAGKIEVFNADGSKPIAAAPAAREPRRRSSAPPAPQQPSCCRCRMARRALRRRFRSANHGAGDRRSSASSAGPQGMAGRSRRSRRQAFPTCRRSPACGSAARSAASAITTGAI